MKCPSIDKISIFNCYGVLYPFLFEIEGKEVQLNALYALGYEDLVIKNVQNEHGLFPVFYKESVPLIDAVARENISIVQETPQETIEAIKTYINCMQGLEVVDYATYFTSILNPTEQPTPQDQPQEETQEAPVDFSTPTWQTDEAPTLNLATNDSEAYRTFINTLHAEGIANLLEPSDGEELPEYAEEMVVNPTPEEVQQSAEAIKTFKGKLGDMPSFIPRVKKATRPRGDILQNFTKDMFSSYTGLINNNYNTVSLGLVNKEVESILDGKGNLTATIIASNFIGAYSEIIYEVLKYTILDESPNGLYDNMYPLLYLIKLEMQAQGKSSEEIETYLSTTLPALCCRENTLSFKEISDDVDDDGKSTGSVNDLGIVNVIETKLFQALRNLQALVNSCFVEKSIAFNSEVTSPTLTVSQMCCLSGRYNKSILLKSKCQTDLGLDILEFVFPEYMMDVKYLGIPVNIYALGYTIAEYNGVTQSATQIINSINDISADVESSLDLLDEPVEEVKEASYNKTLQAFKSSYDLSKYSNATMYSELSNPKDYIYKVKKLVCVSCKINGKDTKQPHGFVVSYEKQGDVPRFTYLPYFSTLYGMLNDIITIEVNGESVKLNPTLNAKAPSDGKLIYSLKEFTTKVIQAHKSGALGGMDCLPAPDGDINKTMDLVAFLAKYREHCAIKGRAISINLLPIIQEDIKYLKEIKR